MRIAAAALACASVLSSSAATVLAQGAEGPRLGAATCRFHGLESLGPGVAHWVGECRAGKAHGLGMIRMRIGGKAANAFFGRLESGRPVEGAIETNEGWIVGTAARGDLASAGSFEERDRAFDAAAKAAQAVSDHYRKAGNQPSADFYARIRERIELQME